MRETFWLLLDVSSDFNSVENWIVYESEKLIMEFFVILFYI